MKENSVAFGCAALFAVGLGIAGMTDPNKIMAFLDVTGKWDPSLLLVMLSAVAVYAAGFHLVKARPRPLLGTEWHLPRKKTLDHKLVVGAVLFGVGWGLTGLCPGPAIAGAAFGKSEFLIFLACSAAGAVAFHLINEKAHSSARKTRMHFRALFDKESSTYTYLLADSESHEAVLIDPVLENVERDLLVLKELGLTLKYCLDTHVHADHISGNGKIREQTGCKIGISHRSGVAGMDLALRDGDTVVFGRHTIHVLETPGHTNGCVSYLIDKRMVFTGDTLLIRGCGRTDFQEGDAGKLYDSVTSKLFSLPGDTLVYPAHDYKGLTCSTIDEERRLNPRLTKTRGAFIEFMRNLKLSEPKLIHVAVPANLACGSTTAAA